MKRLFSSIAIIFFSQAASAITLDELYKYYNPDGKLNFSAERGNKLWHQQRVDEEGKTRDCTSCHGKDPTKPGEHIKTGKVIDPFAASVNKERFTELKKVKKWFKRNCKWTYGRECTSQEKGDLLKYFSQF